jgi:hypothetical protein
MMGRSRAWRATSTPRSPTRGGAPADIGGWRLNAGDPGQDFIFPSFVLQPGQACRVYTNESHPESCDFNFGSGRAIWNNQGDCGYLYDAGGGVGLDLLLLVHP